MNLELFLKLREMVSGGLGKIAETARKTTNAIKGTNDALAQSFDRAKSKVDQLGNSINRVQSKASSLGGMLRSLLPAFGIAGALALGGGALNSGLQAQARQASFETIAGKSGGTQLNKDLTRFAQDSIYGTEVYQNAQTMLGFGITTQKVLPSIKMLGDVAMGDANKLNSLTLAFSQVSAAGKLTGQDLLQFINAGFNPLQQISKDTGMSLGELRKKVEEGAISFQMVEQAFKNATSQGGMFYNMTNKIAETDFGKWQAFQGQLEGLATQIGGVLAPILGNLITNYLAPMVSWISQNIEVLMILGGAIAAGVTAYYAYTAAIWLVSAAQTVWALITGKMTIAQWALNVALSANPIGLVIGLIAALVAGIIYAWKNFEGFRAVVLGLWEVFKTVFTNIGGFFKQIFSPIADAISAFKDGRYLDMAKAVGKLAFNISPVGLAANAAIYAKEGGFTKGVNEAWARGKELAKNNTGETKTDPSQATIPGGGKLANTPSLGKGGEADDTTKGIAGSGPRIINININKMVEKIELHSSTLTEGLGEMESRIEETFLRILNSGAKVQ